MQQFQDGAGKLWTLHITVDAIKRVKLLIPDVDLARIDEGSPPLVVRLSVDIILRCDVIYAIVKPQADEAGISDEQFGRAMGGDGLAAATTAFWQELHDFFQNLRADLSQTITTQQKLLAAVIEHEDRRIAEKTLDIPSMVQAEFGKRSIGAAESPV
jgi:hypothetical protein